MNSCILMAEIVQDPQLRYTPDNLALAEMRIQIPGLRAEDPQATLKAVGWGNLAQEIQQNYHQGDRVIIEGRLSMNTVQLEGYKEKRAELTVQRIHVLRDGLFSSSSSSASTSSNKDNETYTTSKRSTSSQPTNIDSGTSPRIEERVGAVSKRSQADTPVPAYQSKTDVDVDEIPF